jgi:hypothetical protein
MYKSIEVSQQPGISNKATFFDENPKPDRAAYYIVQAFDLFVNQTKGEKP